MHSKVHDGVLRLLEIMRSQLSYRGVVGVPCRTISKCDKTTRVLLSQLQHAASLLPSSHEVAARFPFAWTAPGQSPKTYKVTDSCSDLSGLLADVRLGVS